MIRILSAGVLNAKTIERLNEIPEFEIIEKTAFNPEKLAAEMSNVDALVWSGASQPPAAVLAGALNLKLIILTAAEANSTHAPLANRNTIEIRSTSRPSVPAGAAVAAEIKDLEESEVIAILKDFFNV
ncbi:MAG TPA: hypothetical protein VLQ89_01600 [Candidatus Binatia bacterium]|nr:hypothetical protein [Candidatus Binatia bacterium]